MPVYAYKGVTAGSRSASGTVDADSLRDARARLRSEGIFPTQLVEGSARTPLSEVLSRLKLPELRRVPDLELALFSNQLSTLLAAGVPLLQALSALTEQIEHVRLKTIVGQLREDVNRGVTLADAMGQHPNVFEELYCSMVRAGESSGSLSLVMARLADYVEGRRRLQGQITSALTYPIVILGVSGIALGVLLTVVIPQITQMLEDMRQEIPLLTRMVIAISGAVRSFWLPALAVIVVAAIAFARALQTPRGRLAWDRFRLRAPIIGRPTRLIAISRFARTLATLLTGGVPIVQALEIARRTSGNVVISRAVAGAADSITKGASIAQPLRQSGEFPPMVTHMISVGEASGELETMLGKVSETYDNLVENALKRMVDLLGPVLLLFVASIVVLIVLSTLLPLMNLTASL